MSVVGNPITLGGSGSGGSNKPLVDANVTVASDATTISVTLPRLLTTYFVTVQADQATADLITQNSTTTYWFLGFSAFRPAPHLTVGNSSTALFNVCSRARQSGSQVNSTTCSASINSSTLKLTITPGGSTKFISGGKYNVKVWEVEV